MPSHWGIVYAVIELVGAGCLFVLMTLRTKNASFSTTYGRCLYMRRFAYAVLSCVMAWHAGYVLEGYETYSFADVISILAPTTTLVFLGFSHQLNEQKWIDRFRLGTREQVLR